MGEVHIGVSLWVGLSTTQKGRKVAAISWKIFIQVYVIRARQTWSLTVPGILVY
jgi:hypothetical protein